MTADAGDSHALAGSGSNRAKRVFLLHELLGQDTLSQLREGFSRLCEGPLAFLNPAGDPVSAPAGYGAIGPHVGYRAPIRWKSHVLGYVVLLAVAPSERGIQFTELVAGVVGYLCHQESRIRKRVSELTAVYDLGGLVAGTTDLTAVLDAAASKVCGVMNVKAAGIRLLNPVTGVLVISGSCNLSADYLSKGVIRVAENPIDREALSGKVVYIADAGSDPRIRFPEHARREGLVSGLCSPMTYRGETVGVIRVYTDAPYRFSPFEIELLRAVASQVAGAVINSRLIAERMASQLQQRQLHHAGQVQRRMIPDRPPDHVRIEFGQVYEPSLELGGDFFDFLTLGGGNVGVAIADVVGKGLPGALMMASVRSALRAHAHSIFDLDEIVGQVNRHMCRDTQISEFATLFYGVFSPDGSRLTYCNAGHNPPLLLRGDAFRELETGGMVIGVDPAARFDRGVIDLRTGDILVLYTDGVTEALDFNDVAYGVDRLRESILRYRDQSAMTLANQLLWDVRRFIGLSDQGDDITIVVARVGDPSR